MAISLKSAREIERMAAAGAIVAEVIELLRREVQVGVTTAALDRMADALIRKRGGEPSFLDYDGFPASICTSVNDEIVHGIPGRRRLESGDIISVDVGVYLGGYHADSAITLPVGEVSPEALDLIAAAERALAAGLAVAQMGNRIGDISSAIESTVVQAGYSVVQGISGHGVGQELHEDPTVPNAGRAGTGMRLRSGLALAVEPIISAGSGETTLADDGWTLLTVDGSLSAHVEHTVVIGTEGLRVLTVPPVGMV